MQSFKQKDLTDPDERGRFQYKKRPLSERPLSAQYWIRTSKSCDTTPSRWRVYQFHQLGKFCDRKDTIFYGRKSLFL